MSEEIKGCLIYACFVVFCGALGGVIGALLVHFLCAG